jgi:hypothetical protein
MIVPLMSFAGGAGEAVSGCALRFLPADLAAVVVAALAFPASLEAAAFLVAAAVVFLVPVAALAGFGRVSTWGSGVGAFSGAAAFFAGAALRVRPFSLAGAGFLVVAGLRVVAAAFVFLEGASGAASSALRFVPALEGAAAAAALRAAILDGSLVCVCFL